MQEVRFFFLTFDIFLLTHYFARPLHCCRRPTFSDTYLDTFNRPNVGFRVAGRGSLLISSIVPLRHPQVTLIDTNGKGVDRITENGVVYDGKEYAVDLLIWGTGFELGTNWKSRNGFDLIGRGGTTLQQKWRKGMRSLYGISSGGFPNRGLMEWTGQCLRSSNLYSRRPQTSCTKMLKLDDRRTSLGPTVRCFETTATVESMD